MISLNQHLDTPSITLVTESMDVVTTWKKMMSQLRKKTRHFMCTIIHGGHELYRARTDTKLYQECLLCGYETHGWTIDRRDRRLHLVGNSQQAIASARR